MEVQTFSSFEEYSTALGHRDLRLIALGRERTPWSSASCMLDDVFVRRAHDGGPCAFDAAIDADGIAFMVGIDAVGRITGNGTLFGSHSVMLIPGHIQVHSTSLDTVSWLSAFIPAHRIAEQSRSHREARVVDPLNADCKPFIRTLKRVIDAAMTGAFDGNPHGRREASEQIIAAAQVLLGTAATRERSLRPGRPFISRTAVIDRVHALIENHDDAPLTIADLMQATRLPERTLRNVFNEQFGMSPRRFVLAHTLNAIRRELRHANPAHTRFSEVARRFGVWELGRFARDYRALFGELPSTTLRSGSKMPSASERER